MEQLNVINQHVCAPLWVTQPTAHWHQGVLNSLVWNWQHTAP